MTAMQWHGDAAPASPTPFQALLDARLHAHLNGSREAVDDLLLPLPHERHSARTSFSTTPLQQLSKGDTPPLTPLSPAEATYCQLCESPLASVDIRGGRTVSKVELLSFLRSDGRGHEMRISPSSGRLVLGANPILHRTLGRAQPAHAESSLLTSSGCPLRSSPSAPLAGAHSSKRLVPRSSAETETRYRIFPDQAERHAPPARPGLLRQQRGPRECTRGCESEFVVRDTFQHPTSAYRARRTRRRQRRPRGTARFDAHHGIDRAAARASRRGQGARRARGTDVQTLRPPPVRQDRVSRHAFLSLWCSVVPWLTRPNRLVPSRENGAHHHRTRLRPRTARRAQSGANGHRQVPRGAK